MKWLALFFVVLEFLLGVMPALVGEGKTFPHLSMRLLAFCFFSLWAYSSWHGDVLD